jgi:acyl-coenzyme A synthetase/AMP-(fatty) acid ligase
VLFDDRFLYPRVVMEAIGAHLCTGFYGVPLTFELVRRQVDLATLDLRPLRYVAQAGGAMAAETIGWARRAFAPAPLFVMYGQTEATARLSYLPPERAADKAGSVGRGLINVELRVVDEHGRELPRGETGEVVARGPSITPGYLEAPEESAAILRDGWLRTGDLGRQDTEGFVFLEGRSRDLLKLAGHRVSAAEIESALAAHPSVREAAVVSVEDAGGESAVAYVIPEGDPPAERELRRFCRERLPAFKVPRFVHVVAELPRTGSGKLARAELRRKARDEHDVLQGSAPDGPGEPRG